MAFLGKEFIQSELPQGGYDPLPEGWYSADIKSAELKSTKSGDGQYISVRYTITGPAYQGRTVFSNLNIRNSSVQAEEIGRKQLGNLMQSIGLDKLVDTDQLIGGSLSIKLGIRQTEGYDPVNEVKGFKKKEGSLTMSASFMKEKETISAPKTPQTGAPPWINNQ